MPDTEPMPSDSPVPMIKDETIKDDGRTLIYYTFPEAENASMLPATQEAAHV